MPTRYESSPVVLSEDIPKLTIMLQKLHTATLRKTDAMLNSPVFVFLLDFVSLLSGFYVYFVSKIGMCV